jgi:hypothetical protein
MSMLMPWPGLCRGSPGRISPISAAAVVAVRDDADVIFAKEIDEA